jgi:glycerophosphoryl diester phosphodiesterase
VFHDLVLDEVTDVATRFADRCRDDGHWYVIDFDFEELETLSVHERVVPSTGALVYPGRFTEHLKLRIHSLDEELALIRGLNRSTRRRVGCFLEIKSPAWHRAEGKDLSPVILESLARFGLTEPEDEVILLGFDSAELKRIRNELGCRLRLLQLLGENEWLECADDFDAMRTPAGLAAVARYAFGVGPWVSQLVSWPEAGSAPVCSPLVQDAHAVGLEVHPYTFRADDLPQHAPDADALHRALFEDAGIDGLISDFSDLTLRYLGR